MSSPGSAAIITGLFLTVFRAPIYAEVSLISRAVLFYLRGQNWWSGSQTTSTWALLQNFDTSRRSKDLELEA
jgi:hypothetical protein